MSPAQPRPAVPTTPEGWSLKAGSDPVLRDQHGLIGAQVSRLDGPLKVRGDARFAAEYLMEGMVYASLRYSTIARGHITALDTSAAEAADGVVLVMTHRNAPRMAPPPLFLTAPKAAGGSALPVMQDDSIHWNGEPIAIVLAETQEQADHAASLVEVAYQSSTPRTFEEARAHPRTPDSLVGQPVEVLVGDAEAALADAAHSIDLTYRTPRHNHNAIEPHAVTLAWEGEDLIVHDASQGVKLHAWTLAQVFGIEEDQVHLTSPYVGGGFGGKTLWSHHVLGAAASKLAGRPVRVTLSREGVYRLVGGRTNTEQRVAIGADDDGRFAALIHTGISAMTPYNALAEQFTFPARHMYATETLKTDQQVVDMDMLANSFMRAPGESVGTFALESAIDELAIELDLDPIELRIRNEPETDPSSGLPFSARHLVQAWRAGAERFGWERGRNRARAGKANGWSAWAAPPRPTPTTASPVASRESGLTRPAMPRWRYRPPTWGWAPRRRRRSSPPSGWRSRWSGSPSPSAIPRSPATCSPAAPGRRPPSAARSSRPSARWSSSCSPSPATNRPWPV